MLQLVVFYSGLCYIYLHECMCKRKKKIHVYDSGLLHLMAYFIEPCGFPCTASCSDINLTWCTLKSSKLGKHSPVCSSFHFPQAVFLVSGSFIRVSHLFNCQKQCCFFFNFKRLNNIL